MDFSLSRLPETLDATGYSRSRLYDDIANGLFPSPVNIGPRAVGWPRREVEIINAARISGMKDDEIRHLVVDLLEKRKQIFHLTMARNGAVA